MSDYFLTEQAEQDLNDIWDYVAAQSVEQADAVIAEIRRWSCWPWRPGSGIAAAT